MVFHPSEPRVLGVIDWEISTLGDPLAELSYLCMLWRTPKDWGGLEGHDLAALGLPTEQEMVAYYCDLSKRALPDPALWEFYMAYNLFRVSCIRQGVYARALDGTASNVRAAEFGQAGAARRRARLEHRRRHGGRCAMSKRKPPCAELPPRAVVAERDSGRRSRRSARRPSPSSPSAAIRW